MVHMLMAMGLPLDGAVRSLCARCIRCFNGDVCCAEYVTLTGYETLSRDPLAPSHPDLAYQVLLYFPHLVHCLADPGLSQYDDMLSVEPVVPSAAARKTYTAASSSPRQQRVGVAKPESPKGCLLAFVS